MVPYHIAEPPAAAAVRPPPIVDGLGEMALRLEGMDARLKMAERDGQRVKHATEAIDKLEEEMMARLKALESTVLVVQEQLKLNAATPEEIAPKFAQKAGNEVSSIEEVEVKAQLEELVYPTTKRGFAKTMPHEHPIRPSMWTAPLVFGTRDVGPLASALGALLLLLNVLMQVSFSYIAFEDLAQTKFNAGALQHHLPQWRREFDGAALALACASNASVSSVEADLRDVVLLEHYLAPFFGGGVATMGDVLTALAMLCWCLLILREMKMAVAFSHALLRLPRRPTTVLQRTGPKDAAGAAGQRIKTINPMRLGVMLLVQALRLDVAFVYWYAGIRIIANTLDLMQLLTAVVVLQLLLSVDEMIFECLAPLTLRRTVATFQPLPLPPLNVSCGGLDWRSSFNVVVLVVVLSISLAIIASDARQNFVDAWETMCGPMPPMPPMPPAPPPWPPMAPGEAGSGLHLALP